MLDHVSIGVSDLERSRQFYDAVLRALGLVRTVDFQERGSASATEFAIPDPSLLRPITANWVRLQSQAAAFGEPKLGPAHLELF